MAKKIYNFSWLIGRSSYIGLLHVPFAKLKNVLKLDGPQNIYYRYVMHFRYSGRSARKSLCKQTFPFRDQIVASLSPWTHSALVIIFNCLVSDCLYKKRVSTGVVRGDSMLSCWVRRVCSGFYRNFPVLCKNVRYRVVIRLGKGLLCLEI